MDVRVARTHQIPNREPLRLVPGDEVVVGERSPEWPAFAFVMGEHGEGWVPERHFTSNRPNAIASVAYDTTELAVEEGDVVSVLDRDDESGWWWCEAVTGSQGWVPIAALDLTKT